MKSIGVSILGSPCVGKTTMYQQFTEQRSPQVYKPTLGSNSRVFTFEPTLSFQLTDFSGQIYIYPMTGLQTHKWTAGIVVYDLTSPDSFDAVPMWVDIVRADDEQKTVLVVGNKADDRRKVRTEDGMQVAREVDAAFVEICALDEGQVRGVFEMLGEILFRWDSIEQDLDAFRLYNSV